MWRRYLPSFAAAVAVTLTACSLEPEYRRPEAPVTVPDHASTGAGGAAGIGWRGFFPDPHLQQLITLALDSNRDLRVAALNVETAQAQYRIQRSDLFPTIGASGVEQVERFPAGVLATSSPTASG